MPSGDHDACSDDGSLGGVLGGGEGQTQQQAAIVFSCAKSRKLRATRGTRVEARGHDRWGQGAVNRRERTDLANTCVRIRDRARPKQVAIRMEAKQLMPQRIELSGREGREGEHEGIEAK